MVERNDAPDHAERLAHGEVHGVRTHRDRGALHFGDEAGVEVELGRADLGIAHHLGIGIAAIGGIDHRELVAVLAQHVGDGAQHLGTLERRHAPPLAERGLGRRNGGFRIRHSAVHHLAEALAGAGADGLDVAPRFRLLPFAGVVGIAMGRQIGDERLSLRRGCNCRHGAPRLWWI
jgi:hypothetical protein